MNDYISRQAAIDAINKAFERVFAWDGTSTLGDKVLENVPSAEPEPRWILSGEKPPEKGSYLVWMPFAPPKHRITVAEYCGGYWSIKTPVSAWMPLPEPYQEVK